MAPRKSIAKGKSPAEGSKHDYQPGDSIVFDDQPQAQPVEASEANMPIAASGSGAASKVHSNTSKALSSPAKGRQQQQKEGKRKGRSWLWTLFLGYLLYASLLVCPDNSSMVCRSFDALEHARASVISQIDLHGAPYLEHAASWAAPHLEPVKPHYVALKSRVQPVLLQSEHYLEGTVKPKAIDYFQQARVKAGPLQQKLIRTYNTEARPIVQRYVKFYGSLWRLNVAPFVSRVSARAHEAASKQISYAQAQLDAFQAEHFPVLHKWTTERFVPAARKTVKVTHHVTVRYVLPGLKRAYVFVAKLVNGNVVPQLKRWHSLYVVPQIDRVKERIWEHRNEQLLHVQEEQAEERVEVAQEVAKAALDEDDEADDDVEEFLNEIKDEQAEAPVPIDADQVKSADDLILSQASADSSAAAGGVAGVPNKPVKDEEKAAKTAAKRAALMALHDQYEADLESLGKAERALLSERLSSTKASSAADVSHRFDARLEDFKSESERIVSRLGRWADKRKSNAAAEEADSVVSKAQSKISRQASELIDELDSYRHEHKVRSKQVVDEAMAPIKKLVEDAQAELGRGYAWLSDVTYHDWQRFHQIGKAQESYAIEFRKLAFNPEVESKLLELEDQVESLADGLLETAEGIRQKVSGGGPGAAAQQVFADAAATLESAAEEATSTLAAAMGASSSSSALGSVSEQLKETAGVLAEAVKPEAVAEVVDDVLEAGTSAVDAASTEAESSLDQLAAPSGTTTSTGDAQPAPTEAESLADSPSPAPLELEKTTEEIPDTSSEGVIEPPEMKDATDPSVVSDAAKEEPIESLSALAANDVDEDTGNNTPEEPTLAEEESTVSIQADALPTATATITPENIHDAFSAQP